MGGTRFHLERLDTRVGPVASVTIANESSGSRPNTFGEAALQSLEDVLGRLRTRDWRGLLLTGSAGSFGAGADIDEFPEISPERAREGSRAGHELFGRLHGLPFLTIAAINGGALGGGLELALHCDLRTIGADVRHVGFPEVFLGLIPAWGGTQLAPRLVGAEAAVRLVVENPLRQNRMIGAEEALAIGLVDHVVPTEELLDRSLELLLEAIEAGGGKRRPAANLADVAAVVRRARARVDDVVHGQAPAPYRALELLEGAAAWSLEEGYRAEEDAVAGLLPGPEAQASLYAFDVVERRLGRWAPAPGVEPRRIERVGIVGAGLMATQLATLFVRRLRVPVVLTDVDRERAPHAVEAIRGELDGLRRTRAPRGGGCRGAPASCRGGRGDGCVLGLRARPRGGVRGARREARGVRRARGGRVAGLRACDEHVGALRLGDGGRSRPPRASRRPPLLQPRSPCCRSSRSSGRTRPTTRRSRRRGTSSGACASAESSWGTRPALSSTGF